MSENIRVFMNGGGCQKAKQKEFCVIGHVKRKGGRVG